MDEIKSRHLVIKAAAAFLALALSMMMLCASAFAADDTNKCVQVKADGTEKSVEVGNVTVTNGQPGVDADALNEGKANVTTGDITSDGGNGISADATSLGTINVTSGNIVSTGDNGIQAIVKNEGDITITTGNISSGPHGSGIWTSIDSDSIVKESTITIKSGDINAQCEGIVMRPYIRGTISIEAGNVKAADDGVQITSEEGGIAKLIAGDITSGKSGLYVYVSEGSEIDVLITGTLSGERAPISFFSSSWNYSERFKLTVWKIILNDDGSMMTAESGLLPQADTGTGDRSDFEKSILYIMNLVQPDAGAVLSATYADGSKLEESHGYPVAKEGEKVTFHVNLKDGYELASAFDGSGAEITLVKAEDSSYYITYTVPKGGGLGLSVELNPPADRMAIDGLPADEVQKTTVSEPAAPTSVDANDAKTSSSTSAKPAQTEDDCSSMLLLALALLALGTLVLAGLKRRQIQGK